MDILSYVMGQKSAGSGGGGGDDPDIVRLRKEIVAPEQTATLGSDFPVLETVSNPPVLQLGDSVFMTIDGTSYICTWAENSGDNGAQTHEDEEGVVYAIFYHDSQYQFICYNINTGELVPGDYTVEFSKLVPVTD